VGNGSSNKSGSVVLLIVQANFDVGCLKCLCWTRLPAARAWVGRRAEDSSRRPLELTRLGVLGDHPSLHVGCQRVLNICVTKNKRMHDAFSRASEKGPSGPQAVIDRQVE
jgi:hypothetical protein